MEGQVTDMEQKVIMFRLTWENADFWSRVFTVLVSDVLDPLSSDGAAQHTWLPKRPFFPQLQHFPLCSIKYQRTALNIKND